MTFFQTIASPVGDLLMTTDGTSLTGVQFDNGPVRMEADWQGGHPVLDVAATQLQEYFDGDRRQFDLALAPGGTEFQRTVWRALRDIPYGETISYGELARWVGNPKASRAVGMANGRNPIVVVVPCHRVIGANGTLTGFGGGLDRKRLLLDLEAKLA